MAPHGYKPVEIFDPVDLTGKQVYLAQVPPDFDHSKAVFKSETEIICDGVSYFMNTNSSLADCNILCAAKDGTLNPVSTKLTGLLAFTKQIPKVKVDQEKVYHPKPIVPQKENLHMRHFPTGYGPKSFIDTESEGRKRTFGDSKSSDRRKSPKKPSKDKKENSEMNEKKVKKHKREKKHKKNRENDLSS